MRDKERLKSITVEEFSHNLKDNLRLRLVAGEKGLKRKITAAEINRPGLALAGYFKYFASQRVQVMGKVEVTYLETLSTRERKTQVKKLLNKNIPCCIVARNYIPPKELVTESNRLSIPLFRSPLITMTLLNKATLFLADWFAPATSITGDLLEIYGVGVLLRGESGVGKSECALSLITRGHRLIADDVVKAKVRGGDILIGFGSPLTRHHMEIRGLGIINLQTLFGSGCIRESKRIDIVVSMEEWDPNKDYERLGLEDKKFNILGIEIPYLVLPVRPGRDIALLVEVACLNQRLKWLGYHSARDLNERLINVMQRGKSNGRRRTDVK